MVVPTWLPDNTLDSVAYYVTCWQNTAEVGIDGLPLKFALAQFRTLQAALEYVQGCQDRDTPVESIIAVGKRNPRDALKRQWTIMWEAKEQPKHTPGNYEDLGSW